MNSQNNLTRRILDELKSIRAHYADFKLPDADLARELASRLDGEVSPPTPHSYQPPSLDVRDIDWIAVEQMLRGNFSNFASQLLEADFGGDVEVCITITGAARKPNDSLISYTVDYGAYYDNNKSKGNDLLRAQAECFRRVTWNKDNEPKLLGDD